MQFHGRDIQRMIHACEYYGSLVRSHDATLASHYDKTIHKLKSYAQEMDCPDCWDPESTCNRNTLSENVGLITKKSEKKFG